MISLRYAHYVVIILSIALIPSVIHSYLGLTAHDGKVVKNINPAPSGFTSQPTKRNPNWGQTTFNCFDWLERIYLDHRGNQVRLFVGRSYDHKSLYHHPELALSYGDDFNLKQEIQLPGPLKIPVKLLRKQSKTGIAAYTLVYEDQFIDNPIAHQIKNSLIQLISARKPITLFYVSQENVDLKVPFEETAAAQILHDTIVDFREDKGSNPFLDP